MFARKTGVTRDRFLDRVLRRLPGAQRAHQAAAGEVRCAREAQREARLQVRMTGGSRACDPPIGIFEPFPQRHRMFERAALSRPQWQGFTGVALCILGINLDPQGAHGFENLQPPRRFNAALVKLGNQGFERVVCRARVGHRQVLDPVFGFARIRHAGALA